MAADKTSTAKYAVARRSRLTLTEAFQQLLKAHSPHAARELLEAMIFNNLVRLYRDGALVNPLELLDGGFYVRPMQAADHRWVCSMATNLPQRVVLGCVNDNDVVQRVEVFWPPEPCWEVDGLEDALLPQHKPRQKPGPKPRGNWPDLIHQELRRHGRNPAQELHNSGKLHPQLEDFLDDKLDWHPADPKSLNEIIRAFLKGELN